MIDDVSTLTIIFVPQRHKFTVVRLFLTIEIFILMRAVIALFWCTIKFIVWNCIFKHSLIHKLAMQMFFSYFAQPVIFTLTSTYLSRYMKCVIILMLL